MAVKLKEKYLAPFVSPKELEGIAPMVAAAARQVEEGSGLGNDRSEEHTSEFQSHLT